MPTANQRRLRREAKEQRRGQLRKARKGMRVVPASDLVLILPEFDKPLNVAELPISEAEKLWLDALIRSDGWLIIPAESIAPFQRTIFDPESGSDFAGMWLDDVTVVTDKFPASFSDPRLNAFGHRMNAILLTAKGHADLVPDEYESIKARIAAETARKEGLSAASEGELEFDDGEPPLKRSDARKAFARFPWDKQMTLAMVLINKGERDLVPEHYRALLAEAVEADAREAAAQVTE